MTKNDSLFLYLAALILGVSTLVLGYNAFTHQYQLIDFPHLLLKHPWLASSLALYILGFILYKKYPNISFFFKTIGMLYVVVFVMLFADMAVSTTPFSLHNQWLNEIDLWLGFNLGAFVSTIRQHHLLYVSFSVIYILLFSALKVIPLTLAAIGEKKAVYRYVINFLISCLLGFVIYYFWPSTDASSIVHSIKFNFLQYHINTQFHQLHHYEPSKFYQAGFISFPSYHTIWAILLAYACWPRKWLFYPVAVFSTLVIISALASGWHFLTDIIGGVFVATLSIMITNYFIHYAQYREKKR